MTTADPVVTWNQAEGDDERGDHKGHEEIWGILDVFIILIVVMALQVHMCAQT